MIKRGKEGHPKAAIRHGIQHSMGCGDEEKVEYEHPPPTRKKFDCGKAKPYDRHTKDYRKGQRMRYSSMAEEITVVNAHTVPYDVNIGNHGAEDGEHPESNGYWAHFQKLPNCNGDKAVRKS
ncbi:MAG: hypothetical protein V3S85_01185 [Nitrospirales bacterium]